MHVGFADELRDETRGRAFVKLLGAADLGDAAIVHQRDPVGQRQRLFLIVRDEQDGDAEFAMQALELELHLLAQILVERAERFVHQQQVRVEHQCARQRDALLLAAGKLPRQPFAKLFELHQTQCRGNLLG